MRFFLPRFKKPRPEAERSAPKDETICQCVMDNKSEKTKKILRKGAVNSLRR